MTQVFTRAAAFDGIRLEAGARLWVEAGQIVDAEGPGDVVMLNGAYSRRAGWICRSMGAAGT